MIHLTHFLINLCLKSFSNCPSKSLLRYLIIWISYWWRIVSTRNSFLNDKLCPRSVSFHLGIPIIFIDDERHLFALNLFLKFNFAYCFIWVSCYIGFLHLHLRFVTKRSFDKSRWLRLHKMCIFTLLNHLSMIPNCFLELLVMISDYPLTRRDLQSWSN